MAKLTQFEIRKIQMQAVVPLVQDLQEVLGEDVVNAALEERLRRKLAQTEPGANPNFEAMDDGAKHFAAGGALQYQVIASDTDHFDMNVHHCRYAEMMEELGGRNIGHLLVCGPDFAAAKKIGMELTRTQTRMQGADHCDFRYRRRSS